MSSPGLDTIEAHEPSAGPSQRGAPLAATWWRLAVVVAVEAGILVGGTYAILSFSHSKRHLDEFALGLVLAAVALAIIAWGMLRAEEARLQRELRTARTGTAVARSLVLRRRQRLAFFLRMFGTNLGTAAVQLASGDRSGALDSLAAGSSLMQGGRLALLREVVDADLSRGTGAPAALEQTIQRLRTAPRIGNREADRYRTHVLVKAVLQLGATDVAEELIAQLGDSPDEDDRLYAVWLRTWFDLDDGPPIPETELRLACLMARASGAEDLVAKLDARIANLSLEKTP